MKRILFPTDFSEAADNAFLYALEIADFFGADITTVHIYSLPEVRAAHLPNTIRQVYESVTLERFSNYKDNIPHLHEIAETHNKTHLHIHHMMVEAQGWKVEKRILQAARNEKADMIIMGTTGASGLKEIFLGSIAAEVLENAECPVLAVPQKAKYDGKLNHIAVTTDYQQDEIGTVLKVLSFARETGAQVTCIHVDTSHTEVFTHRMDEFAAKFKDDNDVNYVVLEGTSIETAVADYVEENNVDILAMHTHKRNFLQEFFSYSLSKRMAYHLKVPILAIQNL